MRIIDAIVILSGFALINWVYIRATGFTKIVRTHSPGDAGEAIPVGYFEARPKGLIRRFMTVGGGIIRISASVNGLHVSSVLPMSWKSAFVPWDQIQVQDNPGSTRFRFGFLRCPEIEWSMTKIFVAKLQHSITSAVLRKTPFRALVT